MKITKTVAIFAFIAILVITIRYFWTTPSAPQTPNTPPQQTTNPQPIPTPERPDSPAPRYTPPVITGWTFTYQGSGYDWYVPSTKNSEPTEWFPMTDLNTTYRVRKKCIVELKSKVNNLLDTTFLVDTASDKRYLRVNGNFQVTPWPEAEFQKAAMAAQAIRFVPYGNGGTIEIKMGRTE
jgi:hypothetical protein